MNQKHRLNRGLSWALGLSLALFSALNWAETLTLEQNATTAELVELCSQNDDEAQNFCFGFGEGVYQTYLMGLPKKDPAPFCPTKSEDTREVARKKFLAWSKAHPQFNSEPAAQSVIRFLKVQYPCK